MRSQFMSFDRLIGSKLITIICWLGLLGTGLGTLAGVFGGQAAMGQSFLGGLGAIIVALIGAIVGVLFWRFMYELYLLLFRMAGDLRDIKAMKSGGA